MPETKQIDKQQITALMEELFGVGITRADFEKLVKTLVKMLAKREENFNLKVAGFQKLVEESTEALKKENETTGGDLKAEFSRELSRAKSELKELENATQQRLQQVRDGIDGKDADEELIREKVVKELSGVFKSKDKEINRLQDQVDKLRELTTRLKDWASKGGGRVIYGGVMRHSTVKNIDISGDLDGSTKTFSIEPVRSVISVACSSFPHILRPTIDYTMNARNTKITFTSEIDAASTLATGQTVILTVVGKI